jgi:Domain of unknown function (DUF4041)/T5orf172 domain
METLPAPLFWTLVLYSLSFPVLCFVMAYGLMRSSVRRWALQRRFRGVIDKEAEIQRIEAVHREELGKLAKEADAAKAKISELDVTYRDKYALYNEMLRQVAVFDDSIAYAGFGLYAPHFDFVDSEAYRTQILKNREQQKAMIAADAAVVCSKPPEGQGRGETALSRAMKLTLRAFNGEADSAIANVRWNNIGAMEQRIIRSREQMDRLNAPLSVFVAADYSALKLKELYLTHEHREKLRGENDRRTEMARRAGTDQKLKRDLDLALDDEERFGKLLAQARLEASKFVGARLKTFSEQIATLERELAAAQAKVLRARSMIEKQTAGYVYVVSNVGSLGEAMVKIGLTRRLDPADRIRELGIDAVPFPFDTHAVIQSDDAAGLQKRLHNAFDAHRVNGRQADTDFFRIALKDVETAVRLLAPGAEFTAGVEAQDYRESLAARGEAAPVSVSTILPATL